MKTEELVVGLFIFEEHNMLSLSHHSSLYVGQPEVGALKPLAEPRLGWRRLPLVQRRIKRGDDRMCKHELEGYGVD